MALGGGGLGGPRSDRWKRAQAVIPGGVNSPVRAMRAVGLDEPLFVERGEGAFITTADGERYLDWVQSWGPLIFGHADPEVVRVIQETAAKGTTFGAATELEVDLASELVAAVPSIDRQFCRVVSLSHLLVSFSRVTTKSMCLVEGWLLHQGR